MVSITIHGKTVYCLYFKYSCVFYKIKINNERKYQEQDYIEAYIGTSVASSRVGFDFVLGWRINVVIEYLFVTEVDEAPEDMDPYELMDPVEILSKMPKDYYEKIVRITDVYPL